MELKQSEKPRMNVLIKRRSGVSHQELIMHWFKNHMPRVIEGQTRASESSRASKYIAQLFDPELNESLPWDGVAQLWVPSAPKPSTNSLSGTPTDTFQEKSEPYFSWPTHEYVVMDGSDHLDTQPLTLDPAYPMTRSGFFRVNYLVPAQSGVNYEEFYDHWLKVHVPNIKSCMMDSGGYRYVVNHSIYPETAPYAGMAELYFRSKEDWPRYRSLVRADGMERYVDSEKLAVLFGSTEMVGIP